MPVRLQVRRLHARIAVVPLDARADVFLAWKDGCHTEDLLRPVFMGCATKNAKVITITPGSLRCLISFRAISLFAVPAIYHPHDERLHFARCRHPTQDSTKPPIPRYQFPRRAWLTARKRACLNFTFVLRPPFSCSPDGW